MGFFRNLFNCNKLAYENEIYKRRTRIYEAEIDELRLSLKKVQKVVLGNSPFVDASHMVEQDLIKDDSRQALVKKHVVKKNASTNVPQFSSSRNRSNASFYANPVSNDTPTNDNFVMGMAVGSMMSSDDNRHHSAPAEAPISYPDPPSSSGYDSTPSYDSGSSYDCGSSGGDCGGCGGGD